MAHPVDIYVGARFRSLRTMRSLSQTEIAEKLGVSFQQVQKYEKGTNRISASKLYKISQILNVQPNYFFEGLRDGEAEADESPMSPKAARIVGYFESIRSDEAKGRLYDLIRAMALATAPTPEAKGH